MEILNFKFKGTILTLIISKIDFTQFRVNFSLKYDIPLQHISNNEFYIGSDNIISTN